MKRQDHVEILDYIIRQAEAAKKTTSQKQMEKIADTIRIQSTLLVRDLQTHLGLQEPDAAHMASNDRRDSGK